MDDQGTPLLVASADWHIARGAWVSRDILGDAKFALEQVVEFAAIHDAPLIAAGDLYDAADPDPSSVAFVQEQVAWLERRGVGLLYITGQHEWTRHGRWLGIDPWPLAIGGRTYVVGEGSPRPIRIRGVDNVPADLWDAAVAEVPRDFLDDPDAVLVVHQVFGEFMGFKGRADGNLADIPGCCTIVAGDFHGEVRSTRAGGHLVLSPGSLAPQSVDEPPDKSVWVLYGDGGERRWQRRPLRGRPLWKFRVEDDDGLRAFAMELESRLGDWAASPAREALPGHIRTPIAAVWARHEHTAAVRAVEAGLRGQCHFFVKELRPERARRVDGAALWPAKVSGLLEALDVVFVGDDPRKPPLRRLLSDPRPEVLAEIRSSFE